MFLEEEPFLKSSHIFLFLCEKVQKISQKVSFRFFKLITDFDYVYYFEVILDG